MAAEPFHNAPPIDAELSCFAAGRLLSFGRDRELSLPESRQLDRHLLVCATCRNFVAHLDVLAELGRRYRIGETEGKLPVYPP